VFRRSRARPASEAAQAVGELGWWYQHFELPSGTWTGDGAPPAYDPAERWQLFADHLPDSLEGASVLDVGGNAGYFTVQMALRGAERCVMVEPIEEFAAQARFVFSQFKLDVELVVDDVHAFCLTSTDHFDYVLFLGLLYHLRYPLLVLDRLAEMTRRLLILQSVVVGPPAGEPILDASLSDVSREDFPHVAFIEGTFNGDGTNWWLPSPSALRALARSAGLGIVAAPAPGMLVAEPAHRLEVDRRGNLVFPTLGRPSMRTTAR
jgi:tRNA (mo5U34)-methyltransferase